MLIGGCSGGGGWSWSEVCEGGLAVARLCLDAVVHVGWLV